jgi:tRNA threonylcarbamoyladenosine biosynthesis protein TsaB
MNTKPILAYDCACVGASIALLTQSTMHIRSIEQTNQATLLVPTIDALLSDHGLDYSELDCIVSTVGPGSFTGVRIGLAALHGFVLVSNAPIKLLTTLEAVAWQVATKGYAPKKYYVALRAGKGEVYAQKFICNAHIPVAIDDTFLAPETKTDWDLPCFGNAVYAKSGNFISGPDATVMCDIAAQLPAATLADAAPLYIRAPDAIAAAPHPWLRTN